MNHFVFHHMIPAKEATAAEGAEKSLQAGIMSDHMTLHFVGVPKALGTAGTFEVSGTNSGEFFLFHGARIQRWSTADPQLLNSQTARLRN
jgi:hypothetical protein